MTSYKERLLVDKVNYLIHVIHEMIQDRGDRVEAKMNEMSNYRYLDL